MAEKQPTLQQQRHIAKSLRDAFIARRLAYRRSLEKNQGFLNIAKITERLALESAFMALTQGLATCLTARLCGTVAGASSAGRVTVAARRTAAIRLMEGGLARGGRTAAAVNGLAKLGRAPAGAEGTVEIARAACNTLSRVFAHCLVTSGRASAGKASNGAAGAVGDVSLEGFALGLVLALVGRPGAAAKTTRLTSTVFPQLAGVKSVQSATSAVSLLNKGWNEVGKVAAASGKELSALLADPAQLAKQLEPLSIATVQAAIDWTKNNQGSLMKKAETGARHRDYSRQLPFLVRKADLFSAHKTLKSDYAGYAAADTGYRLWRATYDFINLREAAVKKAAKQLARDSRDRGLLNRFNQKWERQQAKARREEAARLKELGIR